MKLHASHISTFKACPMRYYLGHVKLLTKGDTEALRIGSNWHEALEFLGDHGLEAALDKLAEIYKECPDTIELAGWEKEYQVLANTISAYNWQYSDSDELEVIATEIDFEIPLVNPASGRALRNVSLAGRIDMLVKNKNGVVMVEEHKSTSKSVDSDSDYWNHLRLDTQTTLYVYVARVLQLSGKLEKYGIKVTDPLVSGCIYDVWRKPQIKPKKLSQADTNKFMSSHDYFNTMFEVSEIWNEDGSVAGVMVDKTRAEVEYNAKGTAYSIIETPEMYGARLLNNYVTEPDKYFARREIAKTDQDLEKFQHELVSIYRTMHNMEKTGAWYCNERQCEATFKCQFCGICYNNINVEDAVPDGYSKWTGEW